MIGGYDFVKLPNFADANNADSGSRATALVAVALSLPGFARSTAAPAAG